MLSGELKFEGEYLNGKRNGKGKEYDENKLIFEGEYINNIKYIGKGYDKNGKMIYELKKGDNYRKEYDSDGKLIFEGKYFIETKTGKYYYSKGQLYFDSECLNELKNGKGKEYYNKI